MVARWKAAGSCLVLGAALMAGCAGHALANTDSYEPDGWTSTEPWEPEPAFSYEGTADLVDDVAGNADVDYYTIEAEDGSVLFMIVDHRAAQKGVYLLTQATFDEVASFAGPGSGAATKPDDLAAIVEQLVGQGGGSQQQAPEPAEKPAGDESAAGIPPAAAGLVVAAMGGAVAGAYYLLKLKPEREERLRAEEEDALFIDPPENDAP